MNKFQRFIAWFLIPKGFYCHEAGDRNKVCLFWFRNETKDEQENGYCSYLGRGDWNINEEYPEYIDGERRQLDGSYKKDKIHKSEFLPMSLLWDKCKACGVKYKP
jgi:hypothetical protein